MQRFNLFLPLHAVFRPAGPSAPPGASECAMCSAMSEISVNECTACTGTSREAGPANCPRRAVERFSAPITREWSPSGPDEADCTGATCTTSIDGRVARFRDFNPSSLKCSADCDPPYGYRTEGHCVRRTDTLLCML